MNDDPLAGLPAFDAVSRSARDILVRNGTIREFAPGAVLWLGGQQATGLHIVLSGEVKIVRGGGESRQHLIHRGRPGSVLGDVPLFIDTAYPATAIAVRRTRSLVVTRPGLQAAMQQDTELAWTLLANLARRVDRLVARLDARSRQDVRGRLVDFLARRQQNAADGWFTLGLTQAELAEELGTVREVVVRALRDLREEGTLEARRGRYRLHLDDRS